MRETKTKTITNEIIMTKIYQVRGQKVMLDTDLSALYQVETKRLKESVKRNKQRFPSDFMFQLTSKEFENLRSQIATSSWGGQRYLPIAFTEQGVAMLSSILTGADGRNIRDNNTDIQLIFKYLKQLLEPIPIKRNKIGFKSYDTD